MIGALVAGQVGSGGAAANSYESIATATGTGSSGIITFSSIPSGFKHLQIRAITRNTNASTGIGNGTITLNGDSTLANYAFHQIYADGAGVYGYGATSTLPTYFISRNGNTAGIISTAVMDILDYGSTTKNKTVRIFEGFDMNGVGGYLGIDSFLYLSTSAISSISFYSASIASSASTYFTTATTFALYGIKEA
jgi:hypothetical protein